MSCKKTLRENIIKLLYEEAPDSPWMSDTFYDKLLALIDRECAETKKCEEKFCKKCWDKGEGCASCESPTCPSNQSFCKCHLPLTETHTVEAKEKCFHQSCTNCYPEPEEPKPEWDEKKIMKDIEDSSHAIFGGEEPECWAKGDTEIKEGMAHLYVHVAIEKAKAEERQFRTELLGFIDRAIIEVPESLKKKFL